MATAANTVHKLQKTSYVDANNTMVHNSDVIVKGNLTIVGGQTYAQTSTLIVKDNIITLNAAINQSGVPILDAGIEIDRGSEQNVALLWKESEAAWKFTNDGVNYETLGGGSAGSYANSAFLQANAAFQSANNVAPQVQPAFDKANAAFAFANSSSTWATRSSFVATAGQTTFTPGSGYLPGYIDVFYNGIKLYGAEDYTATDGINVTLTNPATVNSIIEIVGFGANVPVANVYVLNSMASLLNRQTFFATAGQTTFTPTQKYRVGYVDVYYNGLKLNVPEDVTANDGTNIVFVGVTPTTNDVIEIVGLTPNVALANAIPITGGTVSGGLTLAGNVLPSSTNTYYLGSETQRWHSLFVGPGSIDLGGLILSNSGGTLAVSTPGQPATPLAGEDTWVRAQANAAFLQANTPTHVANSAGLYANAAFIKANTSAVYGSNTTSNSYFAIPVGTTAQRPASAANGHIRFNTTTGNPEWYNGATGNWLNFNQGATYLIEYLVVGGGGAGGSDTGQNVGQGGGGGGGYVVGSMSVTPGTSYSVTIGAGGAGSTTTGANGSSTVFNSTYTAYGGGRGSGTSAQPVSPSSSYYAGASAASGGGGGGWGGNVPTTGAPGNILSLSPAQGYPGGNGYAPGPYGGGGGGGATGPGGNGSGTVGGNGGPGYTWLDGVTYAGGGGGGVGNGTAGGVGQGGGGPGALGNVAVANGTPGVRGGGGGGAGSNATGPSAGGNGGDGTVVIRYLGTQRGLGGNITSAGGYTYHTFTGSGSFTA